MMNNLIQHDIFTKYIMLSPASIFKGQLLSEQRIPRSS